MRESPANFTDLNSSSAVGLYATNRIGFKGLVLLGKVLEVLDNLTVGQTLVVC
jgi:hypothetical protein